MLMEEENVHAETTRLEKPHQKKLEIALLLVLGILVGFAAKTEASQRITMGSGDYLLSQKDARAYDINAIQKELLAKGETSSIAGPQPTGGSCGQ